MFCFADDCVMVKNSLLNPQELNRKVNEKVGFCEAARVFVFIVQC